MIAAAAPASTANLGPGFDAAAAALDLWNTVELEEAPFSVEIEGEGADELPRDATHLSLRAFARFAPPHGFRFRFTNAIPLERGLGSSAAAIGVGLVAGARAAGRDVTADQLLDLATELESHADNLAAVLNGGVCVAWRDASLHAARIADDVPAAPVAIVPVDRTSTAASRAALPAEVPHADAAANAGAAMLLGAAIAGGDPGLLRAAFRDRLHERYRSGAAPLLEAVRRIAAPGVLGVTLSGSGPTVVAWAERERADQVAAALRRELPADVGVLPLRVASTGAHVR